MRSLGHEPLDFSGTVVARYVQGLNSTGIDKVNRVRYTGSVAHFISNSSRQTAIPIPLVLILLQNTFRVTLFL
jgi:hypothetical protein